MRIKERIFVEDLLEKRPVTKPKPKPEKKRKASGKGDKK